MKMLNEMLMVVGLFITILYVVLVKDSGGMNLIDKYFSEPVVVHEYEYEEPIIKITRWID